MFLHVADKMRHERGRRREKKGAHANGSLKTASFPSTPPNFADYRQPHFRKISYFMSLPMRISPPPPPPAAFRPEHEVLTTSTLYSRMCHILHTCALNSSSLSARDTPVGLAFNAAARVNQRAAYLVSFDVRCLI